MITKKRKIEFLKNKLSTDAGWARKAALRIFENQEKDEKDSQKTYYRNSLGFTAFDAEIMTSFCEAVRNGRRLSQKQNAVLLRVMPKYAEQLLMTKILPSQENSDKLDRMIGESEFVAM